MTTLVLAIDEGTTGVTSLLFDVTDSLAPKIVGKHTVDFPQIFPKDGWVEHNLEDIWKALRDSINSVFEKVSNNYKRSHIAAVGITNQRETITVFDRKTSKPLHNAIVWQCRRSADICLELRSKGLSSEVQKKTGLVLDPYFSGTKLTWLLRNNQDIAKALKSGAAVCGTVDTYLLHRLTGGVSFATEASNASRTLLCNLEGRWDDQMLGHLEIPSKTILPEILPSAGEFGRTKGLDFLPDGIPISGMLGDQQAALAGQTCFQIGEAKCTYGTGAFLLLNVGQKPVFSNAGLLTTIAWNLNNKLTYALEGSAFIAGAAVQFVRDQFHFLENSNQSEKLSQNVTASPQLYFVPALSGLGAPYWNPAARGAFLGMHRGTSKNEMIRATLEGIAFQVSDLVSAMSQDQGIPLKVMRVDGGAAMNNLLMQFQSDILGVPIDRPKDVESTAIGAALFASLGVGIYRDLEDIAAVRVSEKVFAPQKSEACKVLIESQKKGWQRAVKAVQVFADT